MCVKKKKMKKKWTRKKNRKSDTCSHDGSGYNNNGHYT